MISELPAPGCWIAVRGLDRIPIMYLDSMPSIVDTETGGGFVA